MYIKMKWQSQCPFQPWCLQKPLLALRIWVNVKILLIYSFPLAFELDPEGKIEGTRGMRVPAR